MFYFCDFHSQTFAPDTFVRAVLTSLDFRSVEEGQLINKKGQQVEFFSFFYQGKVELYGYGNKSDEVQMRYLVSILPEGSFYGDFEIFFDLPSKFDLQATNYKIHEQIMPIVRVYQIITSKFKAICMRYPEF